MLRIREDIYREVNEQSEKDRRKLEKSYQQSQAEIEQIRFKLSLKAEEVDDLKTELHVCIYNSDNNSHMSRHGRPNTLMKKNNRINFAKTMKKKKIPS